MQVNFNDGKFIVELNSSILQIDKEAYSKNVTSQSESDLKNDPLPDIQDFEIELNRDFIVFI